MKTILYFHQSADLYGSDKTLLQLVKGMSEKGFRILVVVPEEGPLTSEFKNNSIEYIISPVLKLSRNMFTVKKLFFFIFHFFTSIKKIRRETKDLKFDYVHSNTLAVLLGAFYAKIFKVKHIWHVHEIIQHPKLFLFLYRFLLLKFSSIIVFNSNATADHWRINSTKVLQHIVHNGVENRYISNSPLEIKKYKKQKLKIDDESIVITLIGRISRLKGHKLLLSAFENACTNRNDCILLFVGDPPKDQEHFQIELEELIKDSPKKESIRILTHQRNIDRIYEISDIIVVPSTEPESFGMTALEAMMAKKPVIAAGHGGLLEIIEHNKTGILFETSNISALSKELIRLIENSELRKELGIAANKRVNMEFPLKKYIDSFEQIYLNN